MPADSFTDDELIIIKTMAIKEAKEIVKKLKLSGSDKSAAIEMKYKEILREKYQIIV